MAYNEKGKKGFNKGNPGKPSGTLAKHTKLMKDIWADAFYELQSDPKNNLVAWAKEHPEEFYKLGIRLIQTQVKVTAEIAQQVTIFELPNNGRD